MSVRFNHIFTLLMALAALSAFVLPPGFADGGRAQIQGLFAPIARPVRRAAAALHGRVVHEPRVDHGAPVEAPRSDGDLLKENEQLRLQVSSLKTQLDALKELNADRASLGDIRPLCTPVAVMGSDPGTRESLNLGGSNLISLQIGQPVLHFGGASGGGIAGKLSRAGITGAQVLLITDRESRLSSNFAKFRNNEFIRIATLQPLVKGRGRGLMGVDNITTKQKEEAGLAVNDWLILNDADWPMQLQGYRVGRIVSINPKASAPLFADIVVDPCVNLEMLKEVMVMTK